MSYLRKKGLREEDEEDFEKLMMPSLFWFWSSSLFFPVIFSLRLLPPQFPTLLFFPFLIIITETCKKNRERDGFKVRMIIFPLFQIFCLGTKNSSSWHGILIYIGPCICKLLLEASLSLSLSPLYVYIYSVKSMNQFWFDVKSFPLRLHHLYFMQKTTSGKENFIKTSKLFYTPKVSNASKWSAVHGRVILSEYDGAGC